MKVIIFLFAVVAVASAAPKPKNLHFRNLYKEAIGETKVKPKPRIVGGSEAEPHSIPYQVFLEAHSPHEAWYCGGSLISENYVLTAGHCGDTAEYAIVVLGAHSLLTFEDTQVILQSSNILVHPDYDDYLVINDICLITLSRSVALNDVIQLAKLPTRADINNTFEGTASRVSGWGITVPFADEISDVLNYVDVEVISNSECESVYGKMPETNMCSSSPEDGSLCDGDNGGPLVADGVQIGVFSFGVLGCRPNVPAGYARITKYFDFIEDNSDVEIQRL